MSLDGLKMPFAPAEIWSVFWEEESVWIPDVTLTAEMNLPMMWSRNTEAPRRKFFPVPA